MRTKILAAACCLLTALTVSAYDFMEGGLCYNINSDGKSVTVCNLDDVQMYIDAYGDYGILSIPATVTHDGAEYEVTTIGSMAFAYFNPHWLLTIPSTVKTIEDFAFTGCNLVGPLEIPESVTSIGYEAFSSCSGFTGELTIPNSIKRIPYAAFGGCTGFTGLSLPSSLKEIAQNAFSGCIGFTGELIIPSSVHTIGLGAFYGCSGFTGDLFIPKSVTSINFSWSPDVPASAFGNCTGFETLTVEEGNPEYDSRDNCNAVIESATNTLVCGIKTFEIPNSVTAIDDCAFAQCSKFTGSLAIPNTVTSIGYFAFYECSGFTGSLTIPNSVTAIGNAAFQGCSGLAGPLTIGNSVTEIGGAAFEGCSNISSVVSLIDDLSLTECANDAFNRFPTATCPLLVPCGTLADYQQTAPWNHFATIIEQCEVVPGDVSGDGTLDVEDINIVVNMILGLDAESAAADLNGDGTVDVEDINALINALLEAGD